MWIAIFFLRWAFIPVVLYLKRRHKNTGIRAFTSVLQMCHGHVLNVFDHSLNIALWNFHNTCSKVRNNGAADMYLEARISNFFEMQSVILWTQQHICQWGFQWPQFILLFSETAHLNQLNPVHSFSVCIERVLHDRHTLQCSACVYNSVNHQTWSTAVFHSNWTYNQQKWLSSPYWSGCWQHYVEVCVWKDYMWCCFLRYEDICL